MLMLLKWCVYAWLWACHMLCCMCHSLQPDTTISAYTYERTLVMEQRNELLRQMKQTERSRRSTMQHLLVKSFSRKEIPIFTPLSPTDISIAVPQFPAPQATVSQATPTKEAVTEGDALSIGELSVEPRLLGVAESEPHEPRLLGVTETKPRGQHLIDLSSPQPHDEDKTSLPRSPQRRESAPTRNHPHSSSPPLRASLLSHGSSKASLPSHGSSKASLPSRGSTPSKTSSRKPSPPTRVRKDSDSSSDSSCPEEQSVRTPLLDGEVPTVTLPVTTQPTIGSYDHMFTDGVAEDEIPLGGTADTINHQP